jgi:N-acetylneuraminic acid mutarotase
LNNLNRFGCLDSGVSYNRDFFNDLHLYNLNTNTWVKSFKLPIKPRQNSTSIIIGDNLYIYGGFSYFPLSNEELRFYSINKLDLPSKKDTCTYHDGIIINLSNLPSITYKIFTLSFYSTNSSIIYDDEYIYLLNGAIYDKTYFDSKHNGKIFNRYKLVNEIPVKDDIILAEFPGTHRFAQLCFKNNNCIYVISGCSSHDNITQIKGYPERINSNVLDNCKYLSDKDEWVRLSNFPIPLCFQGFCIFKDKYAIIIGGNSYNCTTLNNEITTTDLFYKVNSDFPYNNISSNKITNLYNIRERPNDYNHYLSNMIYIYDILNDTYTLSDFALPINISSAQVVIENDIVYIVGGETNPDFIGKNKYYGIQFGCILKFKIIENNNTVSLQPL